MAKLSISELDFDGIKRNLKEYLRSQSEFDSYDFEGSGLNILLDILAYNTHYNSYYLNMIANEMFLDSSSLRESVVSHAKLLGYTPRSTTAAQARVNVTVTKAQADDTTTLTMPRFTQFSSQSIDGQSFVFLSTEELTVSNTGSTFVFNDVKLKEGVAVSYIYAVNDLTNPKQIFELPDALIDTSTLEVIVQKSETEIVQRTYRLAESATNVNSESEVYYIEESAAGRYKIYFGDNIFGKKLTNGNLVIISYIVSSGSAANSIKKFRLANSLLSGSTSSVATIMQSSAGSERETTESIKFSAPKSYISNNRAVTKNDYITLINKNYPYFDAVNVWGGEENDPPVYGKIYVAAKPRLGFQITNSEKEFVVNEILRPIGVLTVKPEFVDVDYNYLLMDINVTYDPRLTTRTSGEVSSLIRNSILIFNEENLNTFNSSFRISKLLRAIDDSEPSIRFSSAEIYLQKRLFVDTYRTQSYVLDYGTQLRRSSVVKDRLYSNPGFKQEDKSGLIQTCFFEEVPDSFSGIERIEVTATGRNYTTTPVLEILGDGIGATAEAVIVNGRFKEVRVTNSGSGYTVAQVVINGGGGIGAELKPMIQGRTGTLRTYYFDANNVKTVLNENAGTINYETGKITVTTFKPLSVDDPNGVIRFNVKPETYSFETERASLTTFDQFDSAALAINISAVE